MSNTIKNLSELDKYIKHLNNYLQAHYPANKKVTSEEWNALFLALMNQGNLQEDTIEKICNEHLPLQISKINELVANANDHESRLIGLRSDVNFALDRYATTLAKVEIAEANSIRAVDTSAEAKSIAEIAKSIAEEAFSTSESALQESTNIANEAVQIAETALADSTALANNAIAIAEQALQDSTSIANSAVNTANNAVASANSAVEASNEALRISNEAFNTSNTALSNSEQAVNTSNVSNATAQNALSVSENAFQSASEAVATSNRAEETANNALEQVTLGLGTKLYANGELLSEFNADVKADVAYVNQKIADLVGSAPGTLDTLEELSGALRDNKDIVKVLEDAIATKANASDLNNYVPLTGSSTINGNLTVGIVQSQMFSTNGDVQAGYLQAKSAGHETGTYDKIATLSSTGYIRYRTPAEMKSDLGVPTNPATTDTEQTISGTKKFTANNNTFTRTLVLGAGTPINFIGMGSGTYNTAALVCNATDKFGVECPRESNSGSAAVIPFRIGARGGQLGILQAGDIYQNGNRVMDVGSAQTITGAKSFTGTVGNIQTEAGVYLGLDTNAEAPNANMAITSANTAAYIDMGRPNVDYDFRIIKWNTNDNKHAQLVYGGNAAGTITIPQATGVMALTSDIPADYLPLSAGSGKPLTGPLYVRNGTNDMRVYVAGHDQGVRGAANGRLILGGGSASGATQTINFRPAGLDASGNEVAISTSALYPSAGTYGLGTSSAPWNSAYITTLNVTGTLYIS